jgi:ketosteroid isomerase-like protein
LVDIDERTGPVNDLAMRSAIEAVQYRYGWAMDRGDQDEFAGCFTPDGELVVADTPTIVGADALKDFVAARVAARPPATVMVHQVTDLTVVRADDNAAETRSVFRGSLHSATGVRLVATGWYDDRFVRTGDNWLLQRRVVNVDEPAAQASPSVAEPASVASSTSGLPGALLIVKTTISTEQEAAFNRWYDEEHVPGMLQAAGVLSGRRYKQLSGDDGYQYAAVYGFEDRVSLRAFFGSDEFRALQADYDAKWPSEVSTSAACTFVQI